MKLNKYWFKPKVYGYGAFPATWEGWATIVIFVIGVLSTVSIAEKNLTSFIVVLITWIIIISYVSRIKTDGEWKWRWGKEDSKKKKRK